VASGRRPDVPVVATPAEGGEIVTETIRGGLLTTERFDENGNHIIPMKSRR